MAHAKGPWTKNHDQTQIIDADGENVIYLAGVWGGDASLIEAAPDLLTACKNLENDDGSIPEHAWRLVQDAIDRAERSPTRKG